MKQPVQRELVIRRGREFYEVREREQNDSQFKTTKIPVHPVCQKPAACKWCNDRGNGLRDPQGFLMNFPFLYVEGRGICHDVIPPHAAHLIAMAWCEANPGEPLRLGWLLTDEEKQAGKKGQMWPEDV